MAETLKKIMVAASYSCLEQKIGNSKVENKGDNGMPYNPTPEISLLNCMCIEWLVKFKVHIRKVERTDVKKIICQNQKG